MSNEQEPTMTNEPFDFTKFDPRKIEWTHATARQKLYPDVKEQLDMLFKDIGDGLFGEDAKTGSFYTTLKTIKETHPKGEIFKPYADLPPPEGVEE